MQSWEGRLSSRSAEPRPADGVLKEVGMAEISGEMRGGAHWEAERMGQKNPVIGNLEKEPQAKLQAGSYSEFHREAEWRNHHLWSVCWRLNSLHKQLNPHNSL